jgi:hypothetical protein
MKGIFEQFDFDEKIYRKYKLQKESINRYFDRRIKGIQSKKNKLKLVVMSIAFFCTWVYVGKKGEISGSGEIIVGGLLLAYIMAIMAFLLASIGDDFFYRIVTLGWYGKIIKQIEGLERKKEAELKRAERDIIVQVSPFEKEFCDYYEQELEDFYNTKLFRKRSDSDDFADDLFAFKILVEDLQKVNNIFLTQKIELWEYKNYINKRESDLESLELKEIFGRAGMNSFARDTADNRKIKKLHKFVETIQKESSKEKHKNKPVEQKYKSPKKIDWQKVNVKNQKTGLKGEEIVMELEKEFLQSVGRNDLAQNIRHVSVVDGDGAGYDILSFFEDGRTKYIEVKSTINLINSQYFISNNELSFLHDNIEDYFIYRVSMKEDKEITLQVISGEDFLAKYTLNPIQYSVKMKV